MHWGTIEGQGDIYVLPDIYAYRKALDHMSMGQKCANRSDKKWRSYG
jgi:hypothetical protein